MARKHDDLAAAKAKKQKTILIVGGVLLLAVAAFQVPKLMKGGSQPEAVPATTTGAPVATGTTSGGTTVVPASATVVAAGTGAVVAGVALPGKAVIRVAPSQLASFTLFEVKDPFAPQVSDQATGETGADASSAENDKTPPAGDSAADPGAGSTGAPVAQGTTSAEKPPPVAYATINLDGEPQQLQVKQTFPTDEPLFVLRSVSKKQAKIGVAGGSFDDGQAVVLAFGKKVTLVNTATGARYVLKLVYTGATPEVIEGFTQSEGQPAAKDGAAGASTTTTTAAP